MSEPERKHYLDVLAEIKEPVKIGFQNLIIEATEADALAAQVLKLLKSQTQDPDLIGAALLQAIFWNSMYEPGTVSHENVEEPGEAEDHGS